MLSERNANAVVNHDSSSSYTRQYSNPGTTSSSKYSKQNSDPLSRKNRVSRRTHLAAPESRTRSRSTPGRATEAEERAARLFEWTAQLRAMKPVDKNPEITIPVEKDHKIDRAVLGSENYGNVDSIPPVENTTDHLSNAKYTVNDNSNDDVNLHNNILISDKNVLDRVHNDAAGILGDNDTNDSILDNVNTTDSILDNVNDSVLDVSTNNSIFEDVNTSRMNAKDGDNGDKAGHSKHEVDDEDRKDVIVPTVKNTDTDSSIDQNNEFSIGDSTGIELQLPAPILITPLARRSDNEIV